MGRFKTFTLFAFSISSLFIHSRAFARQELQPPGFRPNSPGIHVLIGGNVVVRPGETITNASIILRDGRIERVGTGIGAPADARVWNIQGLTVYAGFIDPYLTIGSVVSGSAPMKKSSKGDLQSGRFFGVPGGELDPGSPGPGPNVNLVSPERRVAESYASDPKLLEKLRELGFAAANIVPEKGILRGTSAFVQLADVDPTEAVLKPDVFQHIAFNNEGGKDDAYPDSLMGIIALVRQTFYDADHYVASRAAYAKTSTGKRPDFSPALESLRAVKEHSQKIVFQPENVLMVDRAARVANEFGLDFVIFASGEEWRRPDLAKATKAPFIVPVNYPEVSKMPEEDDWQQLSLDQLRAWDWAPENPALLRQQGLDIALTTYGLADKKNFRRNVKGAIERGLSETDALSAMTTVPAKLCGLDKQLGTIEAGKLANLTIVEGNYFDAEAKVRQVWIEGRNYHIDLSPTKGKEAKKDETKEDKEKAEKDKKESEKKEALKKRVARSPLEGRGPITNAANIVVRNAIVWTSGPDGIVTNAVISISNGKIDSIGGKVDPGPNTFVIDAKGMHVTPGLIDCHSHAAILGDVNEGALPSTAMVRIGDVVNSDTDNIYEELAGGLTAANLLHGSANPIGGQNQVIKMRDGASPEALKFEGAPNGIKFALGENVKQSNWGEKFVTRFPQTRMGVRTFINNRFVAARQYLIEWQEFQKADGKGLVAPHRDLELDTIGEILQGKRLIHCHSYRQDEILMMLRLMQDFGVQMGTFQHVLEGYKIADELAAGKVGGSTFADWWAYKFEVYDGIPQNGSLMRDRGVVVSFNSDSSDLARRLNTEAAKATKFGRTPEAEALKFVTINPAKQLRIDKRVGSLEPGKDADFVLWSGNPLDDTSICLQTWIDGKKYFDRELSTGRAEANEKERQALITKARQVLNAVTPGSSKPDEAGKKKFFQVALEHRFDHTIRHCEDE